MTTSGTENRPRSLANRSFRQILFRLITPLIAILLCLSLFEICLRAVGYNPLGDFAGGRDFFLRSSPHPNIDYELTPGAKGHVWHCNVEINRHGFRDSDYAHEKPPGSTRIIAIGDSITFGYRLEIEDTYPEVLERHYQKSGKKVEVLNLGVIGYNTVNEVAFLEQTGLAFHPDVVIVGFCVNDLGVSSVELRMIEILNRYGPWVRSLRCLQLLTVHIDRVGVFRTDQERFNRERERQGENSARIADIESDAKLEAMLTRLKTITSEMGPRLGGRFVSWFASPYRVGSLRSALERLAALSKDHDFKVVVVLFPFLNKGVKKRAFRIAYNIVGHEVKRAGLQFLDLSRVLTEPDVSEVAQGESGKFDPLHPNENGHRIIAERLYQELPSLFPAIFGR